MTENTKQNGKSSCSAPALENALRIIDFMSQQLNSGYGISELSRILNISNNMTFRIMSILTEYRYTALDAAGKYRLSSKLYSIGARLGERLSLENCVQPWLDGLCGATGEVCHVQAEDGERCLLIASSTPENDFYFYVKPGSRLYYHGNAFGKAMLAFFDEKKLNTALSEGLIKLTKNTVSSMDELEKMLERTRQTGIAYDIEEYNSGIYCVGAPVFNVSGEAVAGVGIIGFISAIDENGYRIYERPVLECAKNISNSLGYYGDRFIKWEQQMLSSDKETNNV